MPVLEQKRRCNLVLHCGATAVSRVEVARVSTPRPTETWTPIPHVSLIEEVEGALRSTGLKIGQQVHSLNQDGARYFGLTEVHGSHDPGDCSLVLRLRNSHDKTFPVGLVAGASVFVCDNLSFSGEVRLTRKHTVHLQRDLPRLVGRGVDQLMQLGPPRAPLRQAGRGALILGGTFPAVRVSAKYRGENRRRFAHAVPCLTLEVRQIFA
jgi:hypothetical protein